MLAPSPSTVVQSNYSVSYPVLHQRSFHYAPQWNQQYSEAESFQAPVGNGSFMSKDSRYMSTGSRSRCYYDSLDMPQSRNSAGNHNCNLGS